MKIDRLLGIVTTLLQNEKVTAPYLAEKFEVSRRTINRDVEDMCKAGIPVITVQGVNGGISIAQGYKIDKALFSHSELGAMLTGLLALDSVAQDKKYHAIIEKFSGRSNQGGASGQLMIDLSSHYKDTLAPKIDLIQKGIIDQKTIIFDYHNRNGEKRMTLNPYRIVFKWSSRYVFGMAHDTKKFKLYKLNRLWGLEATEQFFEIMDIPKEQANFDGYFTDEIQAVILFDATEKYRLLEEYGEDCFSVMLDGRLRFEFPFTNEDYLVQWVLSFAGNAQLIAPEYLRHTLKIKLQGALLNYL